MTLSWKKFSVAAAAGATLLFATVVFSQGPVGPQGPQGQSPHGPRERFRHGPGGPGGHGPFADLNLTETQQAQIQRIKESYRESEQSLHEQLRTLHQSQSDPLAGEFNEAAFRSAAEARARIQIELEVSHARMMSEIAGVLTPEQKAQFAERRRHMRRMGPPPPPNPPSPPSEPDQPW